MLSGFYQRNRGTKTSIDQMIMGGKCMLRVAEGTLDPFFVVTSSFHKCQMTLLDARLANGVATGATGNRNSIVTFRIR